MAVIWTRVSTKEQADNNLSLETQEKACRDYAERNGIEIDCIKGNTNESAKTEGKLFREMIAYVSLHKRVNTILVYSLDRFSRTGPEAENEALRLFRLFSISYITHKTDKTQKKDKPLDLSLVVEHHLRLSNRFIKDFKRVVAFIHWCRYKHLLVP